MDIPLSRPRQIPCPDCRARENQSCRRTPKGSVRVEFMNGFHAARRAEFKRIKTLNPQATTDPETWVAAEVTS